MGKKGKKYYLEQKEKQYFISCLLLEAILNHGKSFKLLNLSNDNSYLEDYFINMISDDLIKLSGNDEDFEVTPKGKEQYKNFNLKLTDFRNFYKIYSAVDTGEGEFGYENFYDFETDEDFEAHINEDRFEDLRVAICEYKNINPLEIVFLELVEENRFDLTTSGWQFELTSGLIWDELVEIVNSNLKLEDLAEEGENGTGAYTGAQVMDIIVSQGLEVYEMLLDIEEEEEEEENTMGETTWGKKYY